MRFFTLEPLSAETQRLLAHERSFSPEPAERSARAFARARAALRDLDALPIRGMFWRWRIRLLMAAALVLAFGALALAAFRNRDPVVLRAGNVGRPLGSPADERAARTLAPQVRAPERVRPEPTSLPKPEKRKEDATPRASASGDPSRAELGVLQRARAAVASGNYSAALGAIADHQRRFPSGRFLEEREALRVKALAGLGRSDQARRAAERFRVRFPRSVLLPGIEERVRKAP